MSLLLARVSALAAAAVAALAAAPSPASSPASSTTSRGCPPAGAHILAARGQARVYSVGAARTRLSAGAVYGCLIGHSRQVTLGAGGFQRVTVVRLRGTVVGFSQEVHGVDTSSASVMAVDLADGRTLRSEAAASPATRPESFTSVTDLVLGSGARLGWIASRGGIRQTQTYEVRRADQHGDRLLDSGPGIAPGSLRLSGGQLSWRDRARRTAPL